MALRIKRAPVTDRPPVKMEPVTDRPPVKLETPVKTGREQPKMPPVKVLAKVILASVDVKEAMRRKSFLEHLGPGTPMKRKCEENREVIMQISEYIADFGKSPTTALMQKAIGKADAYMQNAVLGSLGSNRDLEKCRPDAVVIMTGLRAKKKRVINAEQYRRNWVVDRACLIVVENPCCKNIIEQMNSYT